MCACVCVPIYARVKCVLKVININKYKQNRNNVRYNTKIEIEIDVHIDVKQAVK